VLDQLCICAIRWIRSWRTGATEFHFVLGHPHHHPVREFSYLWGFENADNNHVLEGERKTTNGMEHRKLSDSPMFSKSMAPPRLASLLRSRSFRRPVRIILQLLPFILIAPIVLYILLAYVLRGDPRLFPSTLRDAKNLLIVTAHPDDECLFFSPSILGILEAKPQTVGGLLVLSTGECVSSHSRS
jgi:hypothetical protein